MYPHKNGALLFHGPQVSGTTANVLRDQSRLKRVHCAKAPFLRAVLNREGTAVAFSVEEAERIANCSVWIPDMNVWVHNTAFVDHCSVRDGMKAVSSTRSDSPSNSRVVILGQHIRIRTEIDTAHLDEAPRLY